MITSIRAIIRALVRSDHRLSCSPRLWRELFAELHRRGEERRESGAFLLGRVESGRRRVEKIVPYDEVDPHVLDTGIIVFSDEYLGVISDHCRAYDLELVADVHTHPGAPWQSETDRVHPVNPKEGHISLIVPDYARHLCRPDELGIYEYQGKHSWQQHRDGAARRFLFLSHV